MISIKQRILDTIGEHIDQQSEKGVKKYGQSIDDCPVGDYDWQSMVIEEMIDALQYQQKEIGRLRSLNAKIKDKLQETPKLADSSDSKVKPEQSPSEETERRVKAPVDDEKDAEILDLRKRVEIYRAERNKARDIIHHLNKKCQDFENIMEDQADTINGLHAEIADLRSQPNHAQLKGDMLTNLMKLYLQEVEG